MSDCFIQGSEASCLRLVVVLAEEAAKLLVLLLVDDADHLHESLENG